MRDGYCTVVWIFEGVLQRMFNIFKHPDNIFFREQCDAKGIIN